MTMSSNDWKFSLLPLSISVVLTFGILLLAKNWFVFVALAYVLMLSGGLMWLPRKTDRQNAIFFGVVLGMVIPFVTWLFIVGHP